METSTSSRRTFFQNTTAATAGIALLGATAARAADAAGRKIVVGIMGLGRGKAHITGYLGVPDVEIAYVCDVDEKRLAEGVGIVEKRQKAPVKGVKDFRRILEDKSVDVLSIAAPNFWHTPAAILACQAGKHVYVEKPGSSTAHESQLIVEAQKKYQRIVQMGNQRRSYPLIIEAVEKLRAGEIGKVLYSRCFYNAARDTIGRGKVVPVPASLDYNLWQGPVQERPYKDNLVHYNWHWMWHWGGGELLNNGVHALDVSRWGLGVDAPTKVTFSGNRYHYKDDQETPDTGTATFDFGTCGASWEGSSCHPRVPDKLAFVEFFGEKGSLSMTGGNAYTVYDLKGKEIGGNSGPASDIPHFTNFIDSIRNGTKLNSPIEEVQKSSLLCHLGNIAYRAGRTIEYDAVSKNIKGDEGAKMRFWSRDYREGWEPKV
ncbi:MAG TPA: Gfo/Idh/MocA family oxidoreductase [Roseimicrobium sp.]|nr:Gfo/Idh/MocA family oxidoreductase [Roseimicrobium sp.]